jgi:hypothetical protein
MIGLTLLALSLPTGADARGGGGGGFAGGGGRAGGGGNFGRRTPPMYSRPQPKVGLCADRTPRTLSRPLHQFRAHAG